MATLREKLDALQEPINLAQVAVGALDEWAQRMKTIKDAPEITVTAGQDTSVEASWAAIRAAALAAVEATPETLVAWEPPVPKEPEE